MMTEQEFDKMWQRAEVAPHARRLAEGYRPWLVRRRRTEGAHTDTTAADDDRRQLHGGLLQPCRR